MRVRLSFIAALGVLGMGALPCLGSAAGLAAPRTDASLTVAEMGRSDTPSTRIPRPVTTWRDAQIALARLGFSSGSIDGVHGPQTTRALRAYQRSIGVRETGQLDDATRAQLLLTSEPLEEIVFTLEDHRGLQPLSATWLGKSEQAALGFESPLEWAAERAHAHPALIRQLNPDVDVAMLLPGARLLVPAVGRVSLPQKAAELHVRLEAHVLEAWNEAGEIIAHFPVSIAKRIEKRPTGELRVTVMIPNPDYTFDPEMFPDSPEGRELGRKLILPPGPNNPVGVVWMGLDLPGYGIHGTPTPEHIGRTESHGCFRLANWDALALLDLAWVGIPVIIDP